MGRTMKRKSSPAKASTLETMSTWLNQTEEPYFVRLTGLSEEKGVAYIASLGDGEGRIVSFVGSTSAAVVSSETFIWSYPGDGYPDDRGIVLNRRGVLVVLELMNRGELDEAIVYMKLMGREELERQMFSISSIVARSLGKKHRQERGRKGK